MKGRKFMIIIGILLIIVGILMVFFNISYSKLKSDFNKTSSELINKVYDSNDVFTEDDIVNYPEIIKKYFNICKFIGKPKMNYMKATFHNVPFSLGLDKPNVKIEYTQFNYINLNRIAFIDTKMFGIPFQGFDSYINGKGSMKGVLGKTINLFNQTGEGMDKACLVTYLAESLIVPSVLLENNISFEEIDPLNIKATVTHKGVTVSGVFTFNENGEVLKFYTTMRENAGMDGKVELVPWTAEFGGYKEVNGYYLPNKLKATWHYEGQDLVYFDSDNVTIEYF